MQMQGVKVILSLRNGHREVVEIDPREVGLERNADAIFQVDNEMLEEALRHHINIRTAKWGERIEKIEVRLDDPVYLQATQVPPAPKDAGVSDPTARPLSRCRSLLELANFVLPPSVREDALDEWMDEIQSAAEKGLPFRRRALSILFRSLPALALRARLPVRVRRGEG